MKENTKLKKEIEILKSIVENFIFSFEKLQLMLNNQKVVFNKVEIDFNSSKK